MRSFALAHAPLEGSAEPPSPPYGGGSEPTPLAYVSPIPRVSATPRKGPPRLKNDQQLRPVRLSRLQRISGKLDVRPSRQFRGDERPPQGRAAACPLFLFLVPRGNGPGGEAPHHHFGRRRRLPRPRRQPRARGWPAVSRPAHVYGRDRLPGALHRRQLQSRELEFVSERHGDIFLRPRLRPRLLRAAPRPHDDGVYNRR